MLQDARRPSVVVVGAGPAGLATSHELLGHGIDHVVVTETSARFRNGTEEPVDDVILAIGFDAAISWLDWLVTRDARGFARRRDRVISLDRDDLLFVGHTDDAGGGLVYIRRDAALAALAAADMLGR